MEQRGGLLMHAGTVELVGFACAAQPRRLVKGRKLELDERADPLAARRISPVRAWGGSVSLSRFRRVGSLPLSSRVAPSAHEDRWRRESLVEPRPRREQGPSLSAKPSPVGVMVRRPAKWGRFGPPPNAGAVDQSADLAAQPRIEHRSGAEALTGALDTAEGLRRAPGAPESGKEPF